VPTIAPTPADGLPTTVVREYRASRSMPGRMRGDVARRRRARSLRRALRNRRAGSDPLSALGHVAPAGQAARSHDRLDIQHEVFPEFFSRAELAYRRRVYG
jgi:hypothetical protein